MPSRDKGKPEIREESTTAEWMRRLKTHPFLFVGTVLVLVIVIVAFVFLPMPGIRSQSGVPDYVFGYYNKIPIRYARDNYFARVQQSLSRDQLPSSDDPSYMRVMASQWRQAFEETVVHMGILDEMKQAGYNIPDEMVDRTVAKLPEFQENGHFSAIRYRSLDKNSRMNLWRQTQESIIVQAYVSDLSSLGTSSKEVSFIGSMASPRRTFNLAVFPFSSYPDSEIIAYGNANSALFRIVHLSRISIANEKEAQQILDSVKNGVSTFEDAAKASSQDAYADKGGDTGIRMAYELTADILDEPAREKIISLAKGSLSDVVKVTGGWAFYRAKEAARPADTGDPLQLDKIRRYMMINSRGQAEDWLIAEAGKFSVQVKDKGFDEAARYGKIVTRNFGPVSLNYGNSALFGSLPAKDVPELTNAETNQFFWKAAFTTPLKTPSTPVVIGDNVLVLYPLEESAADANEMGMIQMYYPYYLNYGMQQQFGSYFLTSNKLVDNFNEMFWKIWQRNTPAKKSSSG